MNPYPPGQEPRYLPQPYTPQPPQQYQPPLPAYPRLPELSPKSKTTAGLLQLLLGFFLMIGGVGRLYAGNIGLGLIQLFAGFFAWICVWCIAPLFLFIPLVIPIGVWAWFVIDGIILLTVGGRDGEGRPLSS